MSTPTLHDHRTHDEHYQEHEHANARAGELARLERVRTGVRAVLALGIAASVAANILHAEASIVGRLVAAWPPVALLLAIELLSRVPVHRPWLAAARLTATVAVAGIAAWVSYWHMVSVAAEYGETTSSAHLIPVSVDGLVVVASVCLVELGARIHALTAPAVTASTAARHVPADSAPARSEAAVTTRAVPARAVGSSPTGRRVTSTAAAIARARVQHPEWTAAQIAARVGVTDRTVRRHLNATDAPTAPLAEVAPASVNAAHTAG